MFPLNINMSQTIHVPLLSSSSLLLIPRTLPHPLLKPKPKPKPKPNSIPATTSSGLIIGTSRSRLICRAELLNHDTPFSIAIAASIFNTLLFTPPPTVNDDDYNDDAVISSTDARFTVMTIIAFIPYFNWLSWVFALMDTGKKRYAVYALVYLAPYIRTNLSLSPDDSWLPIASIALCILHIQLEASITSGDLQSFNFLTEIGKRFGFINLKKGSQSPTNLRKGHEEERRQNDMNLPMGKHQSRDEMRNWRVPRKPSEDVEHVNEDGNLDDGRQH